MNSRAITIGPAIRSIVTLIGLVAAFFAAWTCVDIQMFYAAVGMMSLFIVLAPFLSLEKYDLFCPWSFVILPVALLSTPQAICTSFNFPNEEPIERMMQLGQGPEFFFYPGAILLLAFICLTVGYFGFQSKRPRNIYLGRDFDPNRLLMSLAIVGLIACVSTVAFIRVTGGVSSDRITDKRTNLETLDVEAGDTRQHGHLRQISKLSSVVFLIFYSFVLTRKQRLSVPIVCLLILGLMMAIALPFYASSRAQVCWVLINTIGVNYYLGRGNFFLKVALFLSLGLAFFIFMSAVRNRDHQDGMDSVSIEKSFESLVLNRNGPGLSKTAHIINAIPDKLEYQYGSTIAEWLLAPIPRALYPTKPMMGTGTEIGTKIYGTKLSGIPPGMIAELYWNFHIAGVIFGMLLFGYLLQRVYAVFQDVRSDPAVVVPIYLFSVIPVAFGVLGNSIGYGTMMRLVDFVSIGIVMWLCTRARVYQPHAPGVHQPHQQTSTTMAARKPIGRI
jgi:oligosaccharide repeat unit polymerase